MFSDPQKFIDRTSDRLIRSGKPIAGGWAGYQSLCLSKDAGPVQVSETRKAFYAGAQHLFAMIMHGLTDGQDITETDLTRMENIERELAEFASQFMRDRDGFTGKDN